MAETHLDQAERHIREGEDRVARLATLLDELGGRGHHKAAEEAKRTLMSLRCSLELARDHLQIGRATPGP
ncbi:hypothetical protein EBE87_04955 [Pseudoroseomonas wenyumeiae]|uniref:Uncharacterized protein n=1 Tax=Teichococcus wenyumeiae TaxID=2478470 RepID=A0A3A9J666_9PROT|nr:hypothetical protein [Pseudoroseomonas wenyumeiae]RKK01161.1 hypothetical protein D6Z83_26475 [Pseudoroseomonas wenyumeiae]RMI26616.1 hypothetical protein EBE87_04955 [Pseudoroseomonas wenyumeiae]